MDFANAVDFYRDFLLEWYAEEYPERNLNDQSDETLDYIANTYGPQRLMEKYREEMRLYEDAIDEDEDNMQQYVDAMDEDENRQRGANAEVDVSEYVEALDEDLNSRSGKIWGLPDLEKWGDLSGLFELCKRGERSIKKFNSTEYRYEVEIASLPCVLSPVDSITVLPAILEKVFELCLTDFNPTDRVVIGVECADLDLGGIFLTMRKFSNFSVDALMQKVALLNSQQKLCIDGSFRIRVFRTVMPAGGGTKRKHIHVDRDRKRFAHSIVTVCVENNLCLPAALILGKFRLTHDVSRSGVIRGDGYGKWLSLTDKRQPKQLERLARQVVEECDLRVGQKLGLDDLAVLQTTCFPEFQIKVISADNGNVVIACVPEVKEPDMQIIHVLLDREHFDLITTPTGFFRKSYFCEACNKPFQDKESHRCGGVCHLCYRFNEECPTTTSQKCPACQRTFRNSACFALHQQPRKHGKSWCDMIFVCKICNVFVNLRNRKEKDSKHKCGEMYCSTCKMFVQQANHECYLQSASTTGDIPDLPRHIYFDYETFNTEEGHVPNMVIAQYADGTEFRFPPDGSPMVDPEETAKSFGEWLFSEKHRGYTIIALNFRSYDGHFVLRHMLDNRLKGIKVIKRGTQLLDLQYKSLEMNARDTLNFVAQSLANLPKAVGLNDLLVHKGDFPHRANVPENWDKVIPFPDIDKYMIDKNVEAKRIEFALWHAQEKERCGGLFDFREQMTKYCSNDVSVLRECALKLRKDFIILTGADPFDNVTIAAACHKFYRNVIMKPREIAVISGHGYQPNRRTSREATQWLEWLNMSMNGSIQHGRNGKEERIGKYFADGIDHQTKTVYEYNGCVFHGHPECTEEEDRVPFGNLTMREAFEAYELRVDFFRGLGYSVETMWSCQWLKERNDPDISQFLLNMNLRDPLSPRDAFKGGRTNAACLYYETKPGEKIQHYDIVSLYPTVNKNDEYPVGHPEIILSNFVDVRSYYGFVSCKVQPPKRLLFPVLPITINGKLMFPLCRTCTVEKASGYCTHPASDRSLEGVWCTPELCKALDEGYTVEEVYEVWHWAERKKGLFADYVNKFLKEKIEASGWPRWCVDDQEKALYVQQVKDREGIDVNPLQVENNPGRRSVSKLMLNSFWGKFGQRDNLCTTRFMYDEKKYFDILRSDVVNIHDVFAVSPECMMVTTSPKDDYNKGSNATNIAIAAFTTSNARLRLLSMIEKLGERLLYYDTDSVIFVERPGDWMPQTGEVLGEWANEMKDGESHITRFVSCGPKVYSYVTDKGRMELKVKGLTQNGYTENMLQWNEVEKVMARTGKKLDFNQLKRLLNGCDAQVDVIYPEYLRKNGKTQDITTVKLEKKLRLVYDKRVLLDNFFTVPFGMMRE